MNNKVAIFFLFLFSFLYHQPIQSARNMDHYYFRTMDIRDGLSQNTVYQILQDRKGFMWFGTKEGLNRYDGISCKVYKKENSDLKHNFVSALYEDTTGKIWIGTDGGVFIYDPMYDSFDSFCMESDKGTVLTDHVTMIVGDENGDVWISVENQGLFRYQKSEKKLYNFILDEKLPNLFCFWMVGDKIWLDLYADNLYSIDKKWKGKLVPYKDAEGRELFKNDIINCRISGAHNYSYIGSSKGLFEINGVTGQARKLLDAYVRTLQFRSDDELWIGSETGLYIYKLKTEELLHLTVPEQDDMYSLADNAIYSLYCDREKGMWIGSYFGGVNYSQHQWTYFEKIYPKGDLSFLGRRVREFCPGIDGTLWIGTEDKGLFNYNPQTGSIKPFRHPGLCTNIHGLCLDGDNLWVGTFAGGLNRVNLKTGAVRNYRQGTEKNTIMTNDVFTVCKTTSGDVLMGTTLGLLKYNRETDDFTRIPELKGRFIYYILEDFNGKLWFATYANGVYSYDVRTKKWVHYMHDDKNPDSLPYDRIISIFEDSDKNLWFMTEGEGFCRLSADEDKFVKYDMSDGFPSNTFYKMVEDQKGNLWLSSNRGLICFNPDKNTKHIYTTANGLLSNQFNYQSGYCDANGRIYMGCIKGFVAFDPETFVNNDYLPPVVITDFCLYNKPILASTPDSPLKKSIVYSDELDLDASQNSFSFHVAALSYQAPKMNQLKYKLEGFDDDWCMVGPSSIINYTHLPYGSYKLRIKGSNSDGKWNDEERVLSIRIHPPFYSSAFAYVLYALFLILLLVGGLRKTRRRVQHNHQLLQSKMEGEKERELYTAKFNFFTNVAHEIRTPLTLIKCPLENVLKSEHLSPEVKDDLEIMDLNANRLLDLVNQLLDFRKTETEGLKLNIGKCDVADISKKTCIRFTSMAKDNGLRLEVELPEKLEAMVDREAFTKMFSNILSNAIKYAASFIRVSLLEKDGQVVLTEENDGTVIPLDMREKIFEPFVQYKTGKLSTVSGTGIGLALSRSLAKLHGGTLRMDSCEEINRFILSLPLCHEEIQVHEHVEDQNVCGQPQAGTVEKTLEKKHCYTLMVVEDSSEMLSFVKKQLVPDYNVITAANGVEALELLKKNMVNLIISDVMMPEMDGMELCQRVKSDLNTSHIPVILLTAKTALQAKIEGMKVGADAYVEKPFSVEYLRVCVANLLSSREKLRTTFVNSPFAETKTMAMTKADENFLKKMNEIVQANMQNSEFCLDDLASSLNMSRSSLNRKIKGILDMTPNDYIRLERLKKAVQLLKDGECKINEICYMVGFNTPSYFTKCFQKQYGVLPKDFQKDLKNSEK